MEDREMMYGEFEEGEIKKIRQFKYCRRDYTRYARISVTEKD